MRKKKEAIVVKPRPGSHVSKKDVVKIAKVADQLTKVHGIVTPNTFLDASRAKSSPTHHLFEWNDSKAAEQHRLHQARVLLASFIVEVERDEKTTEVRGLQYVGSKGGYVPADRVFADTDMATEVLEAAKREAISWHKRYNSLRTYADVENVLEAIETSFLRMSESRGRSAAE